MRSLNYYQWKEHREKLEEMKVQLDLLALEVYDAELAVDLQLDKLNSTNYSQGLLDKSYTNRLEELRSAYAEKLLEVDELTYYLRDGLDKDYLQMEKWVGKKTYSKDYDRIELEQGGQLRFSGI